MKLKGLSELRSMSLVQMIDCLLDTENMADTLEVKDWIEEVYMVALDEKYGGDCSTAENEKHFSSLYKERAKTRKGDI